MSAIVLAVNNGIVTTTSNEVAVNFGKRHDHVLRAIDNLECSPEFTGRTLRSFTLTRDGFAFLCMGFTGKEAAQWKEKYIAAFNDMEAKLKQGGSPAPTDLLPGKSRVLMDIENGQIVKMQPLADDIILVSKDEFAKILGKAWWSSVDTLADLERYRARLGALIPERFTA